MKHSGTLLLFLFLNTLFLVAQKPPLDHSVYDGWKSLGSSAISDDGKLVTFEINPQQGDGWLYIFNHSLNRKDSVFCGFGARIAPDSKFVVWQIKPTYGETRAAKKKKLKEDQMPKNSMGYQLANGERAVTVKNVKSFGLSEKGSYWMAYLHEKAINEKKDNKQAGDTARAQKPVPAKGKLPDPKGTELVILNPVTGKEFRHSDVVEYSVARDGKTISFVQDYPDTTKIDNFKVSVFDTKKETVAIVFEGKGSLKKLTPDRNGDLISFIFTADTSKVKVYDLYLSKQIARATKVVDAANPSMPSGWSVSENGTLSFSDDGTRLYFGTAEKPVKEPEDTLLADEKYRVDIWSWDDDLLQPMQKIQLPQEQKRTYMAVYHTDRNTMVQLASKELPSVRTMGKGNNDLALGTSDLKYRILSSWDANNYMDYYLVNVENGTKTLLHEKFPSRLSLSPGAKYLVFWDIESKTWISYNTANGIKKSIISGAGVQFYDEEWDSPSEPAPYGIAGWIEGEKQVLIRDRYDLWLADLDGINPPVNLTKGFGRKNRITFSYYSLDREAEFIGKKDLIYLSAFNNDNKESGYYTLRELKPADPAKLIMGKVSYSRPLAKAEKAEKMIWASGSFETCPELYISNMDFSGSTRLSVTNPQQSKYNWGRVELVEWTSFDNSKLQGLLYKPENFNPEKKYPMIVYFYEKSSDGLYSYMPPAPARSIINRVYAASNGYLVFVPDIPYEIGYPGKSCYNAVMSGTNAMLDRFSFIDKSRLALDGQSWGGYQIAYLVTQTDLFACAYSGAPVVNMISAYGGIRWGTGMSRMFQYEDTQSRIGGTLWEKPLQYVENSPIFWMPRVSTPLLIMHNDADGAVPWYQGIEFITALRRLGKPAWMLTYNDDDHNLMKRPNMKDLAIRKFQFYDHYLKGAPMPYWMKNGISQMEKGKISGYEILK